MLVVPINVPSCPYQAKGWNLSPVELSVLSLVVPTKMTLKYFSAIAYVYQGLRYLLYYFSRNDRDN